MDIEKLLPHRDNMLLIDTVELIDDVAYGKKKITGEEWFLKGHFPNKPVVPGVILCEILGQSACVLFKDMDEGTIPMFTGLNKVRFKQPVVPGDTFETEVKITKSKSVFYWAEGKGFVNGKLAVSGEFSFALVKNDEENNLDKKEN